MKLRVGGRSYTIAEFERDEFIAERWRYQAGEHVTFLAPTQQGKTTFAYQLIEKTAHPQLPALSLIMKPRDAVPAKWIKKLGHPRLQNWPPPIRYRWWDKPSGYALWPKRTGRVRADNVMLANRFGDALDHAYTHGNRIVFCDETVGLSRILKLDPELIALWTQGGGMGGGLWAASQKPSHIPTWAYNTCFWDQSPTTGTGKGSGRSAASTPRSLRRPFRSWSGTSGSTCVGPER
jgi:hypothetical protein